MREALKLALEALEAALSDDKPYIENSKQAITAIKEALAQPEQIPPSAYSNTHQPEQEPCDMKDMCIGCSPRNADGSCPDAQHKPLTDKQLNIIGSRWHLNLLGADEKAELFAFARAIEAAHGIKE